MSDDEYFLSNVSLDANEWRGVNELSNALSDLEPLAKRGKLGEVVADRLVDMKLAEKGPCTERYAALGFKIGYRLTELGWKIRERGRYAKHAQ